MRAPSGGDGGSQLASLDGITWIMGTFFYSAEHSHKGLPAPRAKGVDFGRDEAAICWCPAPERASQTDLHVPVLLSVPK